QSSSSVWLPSSHSSGPFLMPSPHRRPWPMQSAAQKPYIPLPVPWSHSSTPACVWPSPQVAAVQLTQSSVLSSFPSPHSSLGSTLPSPQEGVMVQSFSQPSPGVWLASSQSSPVSRLPSPQTPAVVGELVASLSVPLSPPGLAV